MEREKDFNPPGWLVSTFEVKLDPDRTQKFNDLRVRLCAELGKDNEICDPSNLWKKALDLLLAHEPALLTKVEVVK